MPTCAKINEDMADYAMLRRGRNALSSAIHVVLNLILAVGSTALTVISGNWIFAALLVILSKWRVVAVRPRYWWINIKANLVDFIVGISLALLVYFAGVEDGLNTWHIILTAIYAIWLIFIKPRSEVLMTEIQSICAIFFGTFVMTIIVARLNPVIGALASFVIGYGASRHVLMQGDDHDFTFTSFVFGLMLAELSWIFYHWSIVYEVNISGTITIPQFPIVASLFAFTLLKGYKSALEHDGKIRIDDIALPSLFSALILFVMIFFYSVARFNF